MITTPHRLGMAEVWEEDMPSESGNAVTMIHVYTIGAMDLVTPSNPSRETGITCTTGRMCGGTYVVEKQTLRKQYA